MTSPKRNHTSLVTDPTTTAANTIDQSTAGAKICHSLSKSLHNLLTSNIEPVASSIHGNDGSRSESHEHNRDVYHQYLNSPPRINTVVDKTEPKTDGECQWRERVEAWLSAAMADVGVGSTNNTFRFWKDHGNNHEERFVDGRYLVWLVKEILMGPLTMMEGGSADGERDDFGARLMGALESWHLSILQLLEKPGLDDYGENNVEENEEASAGVMWQMLLQNAHLTPASLRESLEHSATTQNKIATAIGDDDDGESLPPEYFSWPSFIRHATFQAAEKHSQECCGGRNNRKRSSDSNRRYFKQTSLLHRGESNSHWWPLFGYAIAYAFLSSSSIENPGITVEQKMSHLKERIMSSLPDMMNMPSFDCQKSALWSGIAACVMDEVGEWIVLDGLVLGEVEENGDSRRNPLGGEEVKMNAEVCDRLRAEIGPVVDLLLKDGILPTLAKLTKTPLSILVAESADALLNYSEVHHRLRLRSHRLTNSTVTHTGQDKDNDFLSVQLQQLLANDALLVVKYIENANPRLKSQLMHHNFDQSSYFTNIDSEGGDIVIPLHPMVVNVRARLLTDSGMPEVSRICRNFEDCMGVEDSTKRHCWLLLFERMHDEGVLFEDGWNITSLRNGSRGGVGATLANINMGPIGLSSALEYLENVVVEANKALLLDASSSLLMEILCVKDAVRRTVLKILLPRSYSPPDALDIATKLSDARSAPVLENILWGRRASGGPAADVACRILAAPSLYSILNENVVEGEEEDTPGEVIQEVVLEKEHEMFSMEEEVHEELQLHVKGIEEQTVNQTAAKESEHLKGRLAHREVDVDNDPDFSADKEEDEPITVDPEDEVVVLGDTDNEEEAPAEIQTAGELSTRLSLGSKEAAEEDLPLESEEEEAGEEIDSDASGNEAGIKEDDDNEAKFDEGSLESIDEGQQVCEEKEEEGLTPPHHHVHAGNYSESDEYEDEDEDEADRRLAYEGEYDEDEGRGDSEDDEGLLGPNNMVEILDSSEEEDEDEEKLQEKIKEDAREKSYRKETNDMGELNKKVDAYIKSHEDGGEKSSIRNKDTEAEESDVMNVRDNQEEDQENQVEEAKIPPDEVHEYRMLKSVGREEVIEDEATGMKESIQEEIVGNGNDSDNADNVEEKDYHAVEEVTDEVHIDGKIPIFSPDEEAVIEVAEETNSTLGTEEVIQEHVETDTVIPPVEDDLDVAGVDDKQSELEVTTVQKGHPPDKKAESNIFVGDAAYFSDGNLACDDDDDDDSDDIDMMADDEHSESIDTEDDNKRTRYLEAVDREAEEQAAHVQTFEGVEEGDGEVPLFEAPSVEGAHSLTGSDAEKEEKHTGESKVESQHQQQPSVLVAAAMSSQRQGNNFEQSAIRLPVSSGQFDLPLETTGGDNQSFDNTSAALASSAGANLWENYDDASQGDTDADVNVQVIARYQGHDLALGSVLDVHADADEDMGEERCPEENVSTESAKKQAGQSCVEGRILTDSGYVPDAEATEEEQQTPDDRKKDAVTTTWLAKPAIEDGYVPDASEASEVEQVDTHTRDVRFEADQPKPPEPGIAAGSMGMDTTTPITRPIHDPATSPSIDEGYEPSSEENKVIQGGGTQHRSHKAPLVAEAPSIDEGYVPDTETIRMHSPRRVGVGIENGYFPDGGHTTPGEATAEEDYQGEEATVAREQTEAAIAAGQKDSSYAEEHKNDMMNNDSEKIFPQERQVKIPTDTRLDDAIDEGYLPSAVEGTEEEELSEKEEVINNKANPDVQEGEMDVFSPPLPNTKQDNEGTAMPSVLVATATAVLQQQHDDDRLPVPAPGPASLPMKSDTEDNKNLDMRLDYDASPTNIVLAAPKVISNHDAAFDDVEALADNEKPTDKGLDDSVDEGYLPSTLEGTEEEELLKEQESSRVSADAQGGQTDPFPSPSGTNEVNDEATVPSVLVATLIVEKKESTRTTTMIKGQIESFSPPTGPTEDNEEATIPSDLVATATAVLQQQHGGEGPIPLPTKSSKEDEKNLDNTPGNYAIPLTAPEITCHRDAGHDDVKAPRDKALDDTIDEEYLASTVEGTEEEELSESERTTTIINKKGNVDTGEGRTEHFPPPSDSAKESEEATMPSILALTKTAVLQQQHDGDIVLESTLRVKSGKEEEGKLDVPLKYDVRPTNIALSAPKVTSNHDAGHDDAEALADNDLKLGNDLDAQADFLNEKCPNFLTNVEQGGQKQDIDSKVATEHEGGKEPERTLEENFATAAPNRKEGSTDDVKVRSHDAGHDGVEALADNDLKLGDDPDAQADFLNEKCPNHLTVVEQVVQDQDKVATQHEGGKKPDRTLEENFTTATPNREEGDANDETGRSVELTMVATKLVEVIAEEKAASAPEQDKINARTEEIEAREVSASLKNFEDVTQGMKGRTVAEHAAVAEEKVDIDADAIVRDKNDVGKKADTNAAMSDHDSATAMKSVDDSVLNSTKADNEGRNVLEPAKANEENAKSIQDLSLSTVVQLKNKLRKLNLPVSGRKQELIDRINSHLHPNLLDAGDESESTAVVDVARSKTASKSSRKRMASSASTGSKRKPRVATTATPSSKRSSTRKANSTPQVADQEQLHEDTPISVLSHPGMDDSDIDDESAQEIQEQHFASETGTRSSRRGKNGSSPRVPTSIVTRKRGGRKSPSLPVLPEGEIIDGSTGQEVKATKTEETSPEKEALPRRSTRRTKKVDESDASDTDTSIGSRTQRGKRNARAAVGHEGASHASGTSKKARVASKRTEESEEEIRAPERGRTSRPRNNEADVDDEESVASRRNVGKAGKKAEELESLGWRRSARGQAKKDEKTETKGAVASSMRRGGKSGLKKSDGSVSVETRRSTRSRTTRK